MKTGSSDLSVVQVNFAFDKSLPDADALLDRYTTLTGWGEAIAAAGARRSAVVQRFTRAARTVRRGVEYVMVEHGVGAAVAGLNPDVVHINGVNFPFLTWAIGRGLAPGVARVVQSHSDGGAIGRAPLLRLGGRALGGAVDAFLFAAEEHASAWRAAGIVRPRHACYIVMEASSTLRATDCAAARDATGVSGAPAVLWVGRLNVNKDPLTVLAGFEAFLRTKPEGTLTMVFSTTDLLVPVRERIAASPALRDRVRLVGAVPHEDMARYFSAADIFVIGSHHEGSGYSLMEALACGATPAVTDIPSFRVLTGGGEVGALWNPGDASACARALAAVADGDLERNRARVKEHFDRRFSWRAIGDRAMAIYAEVVERRRRSGK